MKKGEMETELRKLRGHVDTLSEALLKSLAEIYADRDKVAHRLERLENAAAGRTAIPERPVPTRKD